MQLEIKCTKPGIKVCMKILHISVYPKSGSWFSFVTHTTNRGWGARSWGRNQKWYCLRRSLGRYGLGTFHLLRKVKLCKTQGNPPGAVKLTRLIEDPAAAQSPLTAAMRSLSFTFSWFSLRDPRDRDVCNSDVTQLQDASGSAVQNMRLVEGRNLTLWFYFCDLPRA